MAKIIDALARAWNDLLYNIEYFRGNHLIEGSELVPLTPDEIKNIIERIETRKPRGLDAEWDTTFDDLKKLLSDLHEFTYGSLPGELPFEERTRDTLRSLCGPDVKSDHKISMSCILFHYTDEHPRLRTRAAEFTTRVKESSAAIFRLRNKLNSPL